MKKDKVLRGCGGLIIQDNNVLLMKRTQAKYFDRIWSNPGGKIDEGETPKEALLREMKEELGIEVGIIRELGDYEWTGEDGVCGIFTGFLVEITLGTPRIKKSPKIRYPNHGKPGGI